MTGTVKSYSKQHGYGFITTSKADKDIYFHKKDVEGKYEPEIGDTVSFIWAMSPRGFKAFKVQKEIENGK